MKGLKLTLATMAFFGLTMAANAQRTVVRTYPAYGTVVTTINRPHLVIHKNKNFYYADGIWYKAKGKKYVVCAAPKGVKISVLPRSSKVVYVNGRRLYKYRGVFYKRAGRHYVVVTV
ncbi:MULTISPECIES: DUF6515 family protein [Flavobacteriaceae]|uniref:DUF6515 family protein n=1 Tax=Flavobacteriaceae TaxID=49546 RepID=UPI00234B9C91|nr:DUF6515 family protein [Muricauda sp. SP22]MDC6362999.1 DUF6515 family protein [Muricauda sp. SP22]